MITDSILADIFPIEMIVNCANGNYLDMTISIPRGELYTYIYIYFPQNKINLFVLSGYGSESFAAFINAVVLQKNNAAVITAAVITTHHE